MFDAYVKWGNDHCLHLNAEKTKCMIVANKGKLKSIVGGQDRVVDKVFAS